MAKSYTTGLRSRAALDRNRRVIYLGSFSKTIGADIRIGFPCLPQELVEPAIAVKSMASYGGNPGWIGRARKLHPGKAGLVRT